MIEAVLVSVYAGAVVGVLAVIGIANRAARQAAKGRERRTEILAGLATALGGRAQGDRLDVPEGVSAAPVRLSFEEGPSQKNPWIEWVLVVDGSLGDTAPFLRDPMGALPVAVAVDDLPGAARDGLDEKLHDPAVLAAAEDLVGAASVLAIKGKPDGPLVVTIRDEATLGAGAMIRAVLAAARLHAALAVAVPRLPAAGSALAATTGSASGAPLPVPLRTR